MMNRRDFMGAVGASSAAWFLQGQSAAATDKPNIILIMADDLGYKELGSFGQKKIMTPHLDAMAEEGMRLIQFYAGSAVCAPSRCNLMTGKHGGHAIVRNNHEVKDPNPDVFGGQLPLPAEEETIAETMKGLGYATGCFGKWGLGGVGTTGDPLNKGFDRFYGYNCQRHAHNLYPRYLVSDRENVPLVGNDRGVTGETYAPQRIADEMLRFVKEHKDEPFFVYYPTVIPHLALQAPQEEIDAYIGEWEETPYTGKSYQPHPTPKACYAAMITFMDKQVGRLFALLKESGIDENTLVIFTSDNGTTYLKDQVDYAFFDSVGELRGLKGSLHEGGIRVPLIARWPGRITPGTKSDHVSAHYDLPATLAEIAGTEFKGSDDGISLSPTLLGKAQYQDVHEHLFWDFQGYGGQLAVRMDKWKGLKKNIIKDPESQLTLFDLDTDPGEMKNVANKYPEIAKQIEAIMVQDRTRPEFKKFQYGVYGDDG